MSVTFFIGLFIFVYGICCLLSGNLLFHSRFGKARFNRQDDGWVFYAAAIFILGGGLSLMVTESP